MKLETLNPNKRVGSEPYISIQKGGSFYITSLCAQKLELKDGTYFRIAIDVEDPKKKHLYLIESDKNDRLAVSPFQSKSSRDSSAWMFTNKAILRQLDVDYEKNKVKFYYKEKIKHDGQTVHVLVKDEVSRGS